MNHNFFFILIYISISFQSCTKKLDCINCKDKNVFSVLVITETDDFIHESIDSLKESESIIVKQYSKLKGVV